MLCSKQTTQPLALHQSQNEHFPYFLANMGVLAGISPGLLVVVMDYFSILLLGPARPPYCLWTRWGLVFTPCFGSLLCWAQIKPFSPHHYYIINYSIVPMNSIVFFTFGQAPERYPSVFTVWWQCRNGSCSSHGSSAQIRFSPRVYLCDVVSLTEVIWVRVLPGDAHCVPEGLNCFTDFWAFT